MTESKINPPEPSKPENKVKKPGLEVKPMKGQELDQSQLDGVSGGVAGGGYTPGFRFSDAALKSEITPVKNALAKLHELRF